MKKIATITASVITAGVLCYLGLSGYIWYYDSQRIKKNDVRLSAVAENNKVLSFLVKKVATIAIRPRRSCPFTPFFPLPNS